MCRKIQYDGKSEKKIQNFLETKQGLGSEFCEELTQDVSPMYPI
jgi:hypothetical protein